MDIKFQNTPNLRLHKIFRIISFIWNHPLTNGFRLNAIIRFFRWQIGSRILVNPVIFTWVNDSKLVFKKGMTAATGNLYVGLMEFEAMAFVLHYLRRDDVFFDIGANIGTYTVLSGKVVGARCLSIEPVPSTFNNLMDNIYLNRINENVWAKNIGLGKAKGKLSFSTGYDTNNHVLDNNETNVPSVQVDVLPLDDVRRELCPSMIKIDVEGFESEVVSGGKSTFASPGLNVVLLELRGHGARYGFDENEVDLHMRDLGFGAWVYDPFHRKISPKPNEGRRLGDMLYIRDVEKARKRVASAPKYKINGKLL